MCGAICGRGSSKIAYIESRFLHPYLGNYVLDHLCHVTFLLFLLYECIANFLT
jgi:hypothetical protein